MLVRDNKVDYWKIEFWKVQFSIFPFGLVFSKVFVVKLQLSL